MDKQQAAQDLEFIRRVLEETRKVSLASEFYLVLWGVAVIVAVALTYGLIWLKQPALISWVWLVLMIGAAVISSVHGARSARGVSTMAGRIVGYLWVGLGLSFFLTGFVGFGSGLFTDWRIMFVIAQIFVGAGTWIEGGIAERQLLKGLGLILWLGSIVLAFLPKLWVPLGYGVFTGLGYLVTAWLLWCERAHE